MKKCLVIGAAMLDIVMKIDTLPERGTDTYAESQTMTVGGCAYNVADIMKHFKVPFTLFAPVGDGMYAEIVKKKLEEAGHISAIQSRKKDNGYCLCLVEKSSERTFITLPGIECTFEKEWFDALYTEDFEAVYVCGYEIEGEGGEQIIEFLEEHPELMIYYAPGPRITYIPSEKMERIFSLHPVLHLNEKEAREYTGAQDIEKAAETLYGKTQNSVVITLGSDGAYIYDEGEGKTAKPVKAEATDTTGAGDSHIGAVIAARQMGYGLEEAVRIANRVSAKVVSVEGPSLTEKEFEQIKLN